MLGALDEIEQNHGNRAKEKHGDAILFPIHFVRFVDAAKAVEETLNWTAKKVEESLFTRKYAGEKNPDGLGDDEDDCEKKKNLKNTKGGHGQNFSGHKRAASK